MEGRQVPDDVMLPYAAKDVKYLLTTCAEDVTIMLGEAFEDAKGASEMAQAEREYQTDEEQEEVIEVEPVADWEREYQEYANSCGLDCLRGW